MARPKRQQSQRKKNLVGDRVKQARLAHLPSLDQADLAEVLSAELGYPIGRTTVTRLETGERPVTDLELVALSRVLGVGVTWLLFGGEHDN